MKKYFMGRRVKLPMNGGFAAVLVLCCLSACVDEPLFDTDHPNHGKITLITDWADRPEGTNIPGNYAVTMGDYAATLPGNSTDARLCIAAVDHLFAPGAYRLKVYNPADNITVNGTTANIAVTDGFATPLPGWFFTSTQDVTIESDHNYDITAVMQQQVRQLTFVIQPTGGAFDRITGVDATLTGIASQLNIDNGEATGYAVNVKPVFTRENDGKYHATIRLIGVLGTTQTLTVTFNFRNGSPANLVVTADLTTQLENFNTDKKTPLILATQIVETQTTATFSAVISEWDDNEGEIIAI
jgi:hypothetical protein